MSKRCELTGISPLKGHNVSHAKNKTKRRFLPNLKKVIFRSDVLKKDIKLNVANAALRTVDFKGGLDKFLKTAKTKNLSKDSTITDLDIIKKSTKQKRRRERKSYDQLPSRLVSWVGDWSFGRLVC